MMGNRSRTIIPAVLGAIVLVAGCSATPSNSPSAGPAVTSSAPTASPSPTPSQTTPAGEVDQALADHCGGAPERYAGFTTEVVKGPNGDSLMTATIGTGSTTAILLHQTNGDGLCGFAFFARQLAASGVRAIAVDLCGYGRSECNTALTATPATQVQVVTAAARKAGAKRVVLVGASMGGALALEAAAAVKAAAVVDLSGPAAFDNSLLSRDATTITMPALLAFSPDDAADLAAAKKALQTMPTNTKRLIELADGHGYDFLFAEEDGPSATGQVVIDWVKGRYA